MLGHYLAVPGKVGLLERRLGEGGLGIQEAGELGDELVAAGQEVVDLLLEPGFLVRGFGRERVQAGILRVAVEEGFGLRKPGNC